MTWFLYLCLVFPSVFSWFCNMYPKFFSLLVSHHVTLLPVVCSLVALPHLSTRCRHCPAFSLVFPHTCLPSQTFVSSRSPYVCMNRPSCSFDLCRADWYKCSDEKFNETDDTFSIWIWCHIFKIRQIFSQNNTLVWKIRTLPHCYRITKRKNTLLECVDVTRGL